MFLQNIYEFVCGYVFVEAEGYFVERLINLCQIKNIKIWDVSFKHAGVIKFKVKKSDSKKMEELAKITKTNYAITKECRSFVCNKKIQKKSRLCSYCFNNVSCNRVGIKKNLEY